MPRGKNYVNNNRGLTMQRHQKETRMETCFYGRGCTRPDCMYLHPTKTGDKHDDKKSNEPCMPFLAGLCTFTAQGCHKRHPPKEEVDRLIAKYRRRPCRFGESCKTNGCLYVHPGDEGAEAVLQRPGPGGLNSLSFPPLVSHNIEASTSWLNPVQTRLPANSAWKPHPPSIRPMPGQGAILGTSGSTRAYPAQQNVSRAFPDRPAPVYNAQGTFLSAHAKEFTPGGI